MAVAVRLPAGLKAWAALLCALGALALTDTAAKAQNPTGDPFRDPFISGPGQGPEMVVLPAGRFTMGSPALGSRGPGDEGPQRMVQIGYRLAVGRYEVSVDEFSAFAEETGWTPDEVCLRWFSGQVRAMPGTSWLSPGFEQSGDHPVTCVSWHDAQAYVDWLNHKTGLTDRADRYRLPSEAEWEYAARAGTTSTYFWGEEGNQACAYANGGDASLARALPAVKDMTARALREGDTSARMLECDDGTAFTSAVGSYRPNAFGLYDMVGNVWEYVADCWRESLPKSGRAYMEDTCQIRRVRGGSWDDWAEELRSARRSRVKPDAPRNDGGFRLARTLSATEAERIGE